MSEEVKPFLTINQQIQLLKNRGLIIPEDKLDLTKKFLLNNNYYRISGYTLTLRKDDKFYKNANIDNVVQIYEFDRRLRHIILTITEEIEVRVKSLIAYYHTKTYGAIGYQDINCFQCLKDGKVDRNSVKEYLYIIHKAEMQKKSMIESEAFLSHHIKNKKGVLPLWAYVEVMTISDISKLYSLLDISIQKDIARDFGYPHNTANEIVDNMLHSITILRNICAHGGRLYNRLFIRKPKLSTRQKVLLRKDKEGNIIYDKLFSYILVLKSLSIPSDFELLKNHLIDLCQTYGFVEMKYYGFPDNWKDVL